MEYLTHFGRKNVLKFYPDLFKHVSLRGRTGEFELVKIIFFRYITYNLQMWMCTNEKIHIDIHLCIGIMYTITKKCNRDSCRRVLGVPKRVDVQLQRQKFHPVMLPGYIVHINIYIYIYLCTYKECRVRVQQNITKRLVADLWRTDFDSPQENPGSFAFYVLL